MFKYSSVVFLWDKMKELKTSILAVAAILVGLGVLAMFSISAVPVAALDNEQSGTMSASVAVAVDVEVSQWPNWGSLSKGADNQLADTNAGNPLLVTIKSTTTVQTTVSFEGSDNLQKTSGTYDYIGIENVKFDKDSYSAPPDYTLTTSYQDVWTDIPVPGASDTTKDAYFTISTRADQMAGTYSGTLYVKATGTE